MPPQQPSTMGIQWHEVTWYSKLGAVILFLGVVPALSFYIGMQYAQITSITVNNTNDASPTQQQEVKDSAISFRTNIDQKFGIQAQVPADWVTKSSEGALLIASPDFVTYVGSTSIVGSAFVLQTPQEVSQSLTNPDSYRQFILSQKWSDGAVPKEIKLGGEVAFIRQTSIACGMGCDDADIPAFTIETVHGGKIYYISFQYDHLTPAKQKVLDTFIQSFMFLN